jgi:hypothetical protein
MCEMPFGHRLVVVAAAGVMLAERKMPQIETRGGSSLARERR